MNLKTNHQLNFISYTPSDKQIEVQVVLKDGTIWMTQKSIAELLGVQIPAISKRFKNIFETGELAESRVIFTKEKTIDDGKRYHTKYYNLDAIMSVGYKINSTKAAEFRQWAIEQSKK